MKNIHCKFINFWPGFDFKYYFKFLNDSFNSLNINLTVDKNEQHPDILFSSVFGNIEDAINSKAKIKIFYTRENLDKRYENEKESIEKESIEKYKDLFDFIIGFKDDGKYINFPQYYISIYKISKSIEEFNVLCKNNQIYDDRKNLCLISRNFHHIRTSLLDSFNKNNFTVDCPGFVGKNMNIVVHNKINFIKNYYINICPENSYSPGYTTEKLFDCCFAGCVPIYYGCDNLSDGFYNKERILYLNKDLSNYNEIVHKTIYLLKNKHELLEFMNQNPFALNLEDYIANTQNKLIKLAKQILSML